MYSNVRYSFRLYTMLTNDGRHPQEPVPLATLHLDDFFFLMILNIPCFMSQTVSGTARSTATEMLSR
jgi:hypothetical protein